MYTHFIKTILFHAIKISTENVKSDESTQIEETDIINNQLPKFIGNWFKLKANDIICCHTIYFLILMFAALCLT